MRYIIKGFRYIGLGIKEMLVGGALIICRAALSVRTRYRKWRLKRATAYVNRFGYEVDLNSRIKMGGKAYYVMSYDCFQDIESRREVRLNLIGVSQYRELTRRIKEYAR